MLQGDERFAVASRDEGLRKVTRLTWRAGGVAVICSALIAAAFGHNIRQSPAAPPQQGGIVIPAQPPAQVPGAGQVTSGAS